MGNLCVGQASSHVAEQTRSINEDRPPLAARQDSRHQRPIQTSTGNSPSAQVSHEAVSTIFGEASALSASVASRISSHNTENPAATGVATTPLFQQAMADAMGNADAAGNAMKTHKFASIPLNSSVYLEMGSIFDNSVTETINSGQFQAVNLMKDAEFTKAITDFANTVYQKAGGDSDFELAPNLLQIRKQVTESVSADDLHQDKKRSAITMTLPLQGAKATEIVEPENMVFLKEGMFNQWVLTEEAKEAGKTVDDVITRGDERAMTILSGKDVFEDFDALVHKTPDNSLDRMLGLFRFNAVPKE